MPRLHDAGPLLLAVALVCLNGCSKKEPAGEATIESTTTQPATTPAAAPAPPAPEPAPAPAESAAASASAAATTEAAPAPSSAAVEAPPSAPEPAPAAPAAAQPTATAAAKPVDGAQIAQGVCMACHQAGMNGAPKFGNKVAWAPRIAQGREKLYEHAIKGLRGMPPKGGSTNLTDDQVKAAVDYMVKVAGGYQD